MWSEKRIPKCSTTANTFHPHEYNQHHSFFHASSLVQSHEKTNFFSEPKICVCVLCSLSLSRSLIAMDFCSNDFKCLQHIETFITPTRNENTLKPALDHITDINTLFSFSPIRQKGALPHTKYVQSFLYCHQVFFSLSVICVCVQLPFHNENHQLQSK